MTTPDNPQQLRYVKLKPGEALVIATDDPEPVFRPLPPSLDQLVGRLVEDTANIARLGKSDPEEDTNFFNLAATRIVALQPLVEEYDPQVVLDSVEGWLLNDTQRT